MKAPSGLLGNGMHLKSAGDGKTGNLLFSIDGKTVTSEPLRNQQWLRYIQVVIGNLI